MKLFWILAANETGAGFYLLIGLVYQSCLLAALLHRFNNVMHR